MKASTSVMLVHRAEPRYQKGCSVYVIRNGAEPRYQKGCSVQGMVQSQDTKKAVSSKEWPFDLANVSSRLSLSLQSPASWYSTLKMSLPVLV